MTRIACVQLEVASSEPPDDRRIRAIDLVAEAAAGGAEIVLLPELWHAGAFEVEMGIELAEPLEGPLALQLACAARKHRVWLHGGSFVEERGSGEYCNTSVVFDPAGELVAVYRKIHLFGFDSAEAKLLAAGSDVVVVPTPLGPTGLATCYDLRFPELFRAFVDAGATAVLICSGWPASRISRWSVLAQARAIENLINLVGCNETGRQAGVELGGNSICCDPWGEVVAQAGPAEEVLVAELDSDQPTRARAQLPALLDRRLR